MSLVPTLNLPLLRPFKARSTHLIFGVMTLQDPEAPTALGRHGGIADEHNLDRATLDDNEKRQTRTEPGPQGTPVSNHEGIRGKPYRTF